MQRFRRKALKESVQLLAPFRKGIFSQPGRNHMALRPAIKLVARNVRTKSVWEEDAIDRWLSDLPVGTQFNPNLVGGR